MTINFINSHASLKRFFKNFLFILAIVLVSGSSRNIYSQCGTDNCSISFDLVVSASPAVCCTTTTAGMTSWTSSDIGCVNMGATSPDVFMSITPTVSGYLTIDFTAITIAGTVQYYLFDNFGNSDNCPSLNAGGIVIDSDCFNAATPPTPINSAYVIAGERYWMLVSSPPGSTPGSFVMCYTITNQAQTGGQDCPTGTDLCNKNLISIATLSVAGGGAISGDCTAEDVSSSTSMFGQNSCGIGSCLGDAGGDGGGEVNSSWYLFTCGASGTLTMAIRPNNILVTCPSTINSDDYDFILLDITKTAAPYYTCNINNVLGGADSATILSCNYSATRGITGFGASPTWTTMGYTGTSPSCDVGVDDFSGAAPGGQWNLTTPSLVCGRTYALMVSNFTAASVAGFTLQWGGTSLFGVQPAAFTNPVISGTPACNIATTITAPLCGGSLIFSYRYLINWGDGTSTLATTTNVTHSYTASGTYSITMIVTDPVGCQDGYAYDIVINCPLPVELGNFTGFHDETKQINRVDWYTYSETNSSHFIVESSADASNWKEIGTVPAAGYSNTTKYYHINDPNYHELTYYRLKQVDFNGTFHIYDPIAIKTDGHISTGGTLMQANIYPNPSDGMINITLPNDLPSYLVIYDMVGRQVFTQTLQGSSQHEVNLQGLREGTYIVSIESAAGSCLQKLILN